MPKKMTCLIPLVMAKLRQVYLQSLLLICLALGGCDALPNTQLNCGDIACTSLPVREIVVTPEVIASGDTARIELNPIYEDYLYVFRGISFDLGEFVEAGVEDGIQTNIAHWVAKVVSDTSIANHKDVPRILSQDIIEIVAVLQ